MLAEFVSECTEETVRPDYFIKILVFLFCNLLLSLLCDVKF